jgi:hypothetical protein
MKQANFAARACVFGLCCYLVSCRVWAEEGATLAGVDVKLSGFATFGLTKSTSPDAEFVRDLSQPGGSRNTWSHAVDSLFGVQTNFQLSDSLQGVGQVVWRHRYDGSWRPVVNSAFLNYDWSPNISVRLGRFGTEFYMLADSRLVGFSFTPVRPPTDYFAPLPFYYIDGADISLTIPMDSNQLKFKVFYGGNNEKIPVGDQVWRNSGNRLLGFYADFQRGPWQIRATYAQIRFAHDFPLQELVAPLRATGSSSALAAADSLSIAGRRANYYSGGIVYDDGPLQSQLMLGHTARGGALFESATAYYGLLAYRLAQATPFVGYSRAYSAHKEASFDATSTVGPAMNAALNGGVKALMRGSHVDQRSIFIGARFNFRPTMAVKAQLDHITGEPDSLAFVQKETARWNGRTNVISLTLDMTF